MVEAVLADVARSAAHQLIGRLLDLELAARLDVGGRLSR